MVFEKVREIICNQLDVAEDDVTMESNIADDLPENTHVAKFVVVHILF